jgi:hypothetical protein
VEALMVAAALRFLRVTSVLAAVVAAAAGCGKKEAPNPHAAGTPPTNAVLDAWSGAGLAPQSFVAVDPPPYGAKYCERGNVNGVETLVCEYADDAAITKGQQQLRDEWNKAGVQTAVAVRSKRTLLSAVDRERRDPNGKTINQLIQTFRKM